MTQYRKPDQYYIDQYDRETIKLIKEKEAEYNGSSEFEKYAYMNWIVRDKGIERARAKNDTIQLWIKEDELKDKILMNTQAPSKIRCNHCNTLMELEGPLFEEMVILFLFKCPLGHLPKKIVYSDGNEQVIPEPKCSECGYRIKTKATRTKTTLTSVYTCTGCGKVDIDKISLKPKVIKPIKEKDRLKYCSTSPSLRTIMEGLNDIYKLKPILEKSAKQNKYQLEKIEKPNIPQLEQRLYKIVESHEFIKFQFDKPEIGSYVTITFSTQDPTDRSERDSIKILSRAIKQELFTTNWRLMTKGIDYRLGFLTGQLRAYEQHEDLIKIAKEISIE
jgi:hypothetical protein